MQLTKKEFDENMMIIVLVLVASFAGIQLGIANRPPLTNIERTLHYKLRTGNWVQISDVKPYTRYKNYE